MKDFAREIIHDFVCLFYPRYCLACHEALVKGELNVCTSCMLHLPRTNFHKTPNNVLFTKLQGRMQLDHAFSFLLFIKDGRVQRLLHELKYNNRPELAVELGRVYGEELLPHHIQNSIDLIIPVPLHASKLRKRGYNQSEAFAQGLSDSLQRSVNATCLERVLKTETQTRKSKLMRWENVREVFSVRDNGEVKGKRILLVDDVITTGATIEACAMELSAAGATSISVASIAYAEGY
jgi:ComF family protein